VKSNGLYPRVRTDTAGTAMVSQGGAVGLVETVRIVGLDRALSEALVPWRKPNAVHNPGKVIIDLALSLAVGGDCLADVAVLRDQPGVFGAVASDPRVSRLVDTLAGDASKALAAIDTARAQVRARVWSLAGEHAPDHAAGVDDPVVVDLDATLLTSHSDKEQAAPTFKRGFLPPTAQLPRPRPGLVNHCRSCCAKATPDRTPPPTTSRWRGRRSRNCPGTGPAADPARPCWCAPTAPAAPTPSSSG